MKLKLILIVVLTLVSVTVRAQGCNIEIQILEDKFMFGEVLKMDKSEPVKKMQVNFSEEFMEVIMPVDGENFLIKVENQNCQAYCSRAKRVRQLHSGDEKLVRNLFKDKREDILRQIKACNA